MAWILNNPMISLCYGFLYLAVLMLWFPGKTRNVMWVGALSVSIILGLMSDQLGVITLIPITLMVISVHYSQSPASYVVRYAAGTFVLCLSIGLAMHRFPGFYNLNVLDHVYISHDAIPFTYRAVKHRHSCR